MRGLILLAAIAGFYLAYRWFIQQTRKTQLQAAAVAIGALLIALAVSGRLNWVFALFGAVLPFLRRIPSLLLYLPLFQRLYRQFKHAQPAAGRSAGQQSNVETRFIRMTLDHDSGEMNGYVLGGQYAGAELGSLSLEQLIELLGRYDREDEESSALLRAYLDRVHGENWHQRSRADDGQSQAAGFSSGMSRREAYDILGLEEGASEQQIIAAHRRLMQKLHPDRGGTTFLAAKINQAKELLLSK